AGNRPPVARVAASTRAGALPLQVALSSRGTVDHDGDDLRYAWVVAPDGEGAARQFSEPAPTLTLEQPGRYTATLVVSDPEGAADTASLVILAGNDPPRVDLELTRGNRTFFFPGDTITYTTAVVDREDGSLAEGGIPEGRVAVTLEYLPAGLTREE